MDVMHGHAGHNMTAMTNASTATTTMAMILANMTMGPSMNHHDHGSHETMPNLTNHGNHSMVGNGTMGTGHDHDMNHGEHDHSAHVNTTMPNTNHGHNHDHSATDDGTMDHSDSHDNHEGHDLGGTQLAGHGGVSTCWCSTIYGYQEYICIMDCNSIRDIPGAYSLSETNELISFRHMISYMKTTLTNQVTVMRV